MRSIHVSTILLASCSAAAMAEEKCRNPPPVFDCNDWRKSDSGRLVAKRDLTAGLLGMTEGSYIGDHTMIDGLDYSEALRKQCGGGV